VRRPRAVRSLPLALLALVSCSSELSTLHGAKVVFEGRKAFSESELLEAARSELREYDRSPDPTLLSDAAFRMAHRYELAGYAGTRVEFSESPERIVFTITEARYVALGKVRVNGNRALSDEELLAKLPRNLLGSVPYSERLAGEIRNHLVRAYADLGYAEVVVGEPEARLDGKRKEMDLTYTVTEGKRYVVSGLEGLPDVPELAKKLSSLVGKPFTPRAADEVEAAVLDGYREHGHPFVRVVVRPRLDRGTGSVVLVLDLDPGPSAKLGDPVVRGNGRTKESWIERRADLERGKEYQASDLRRAEKRLMETALFTTVEVNPGPIQEDTGQVPVEIKVEERDPGEVAVRLGYGTLDGPRGGVDFRYANLLGGAELFRAAGTVSRYGYRTEAELAFPFIFGSDFRPGVSGYYELENYPSFEAVAIGEVLSLSYPVLEKVQGTVGVRHAAIRTKEVEPGVPPGDLLDFSYTAPFVSAIWDARDSPLLPTKGYLVDARVEWSGEPFSRDIQFLNAGGRAVALFPLPWALVLAASLQGGVIAPLGSTEVIPVSLRYFAGGTNTVRGFEFASLGPQANGKATGGECFLALQTEVRYPIWGDLHGAVFSDRGGVWQDYRDVNLSECRYCVGTGLRYHTPAGAIVGDFAWNPARRAGEHGWEFHFSIGFPF
jgi:outer membrane protein assembly complex protein YaeT